MTKNNLHKCLGWLLQQTTTIQTKELGYLVQTEGCTDSQTWAEVDGLNTLEDEDMARLQFAPQSTTRPRLLGRQNGQMLPTPSTSNGTISDPSPSLRNKTSRTTTPARVRPEVPPTPGTDYGSIGVFDIDDLDDMVNLTEETDIVAPEQSVAASNNDWVRSVEPRAKRGHKRSSDEFFEDTKLSKLKKSQESPHSTKRVAVEAREPHVFAHHTSAGSSQTSFKLSEERSPRRDKSVSPVKNLHRLRDNGLEKPELVSRRQACFDGQHKAKQPMRTIIRDSDDDEEEEALPGSGSNSPSPKFLDASKDSKLLTEEQGQVHEFSDRQDMQECHEIITTSHKPPIPTQPAAPVMSLTPTTRGVQQPTSSPEPSASGMSIQHSQTQLDALPNISLNTFLEQSQEDDQKFLATLEARKKVAKRQIVNELYVQAAASAHLSSAFESAKENIARFNQMIELKQLLHQKNSEITRLKLRLDEIVENDDDDMDLDNPQNTIRELTGKVRALNTDVDRAYEKLALLCQALSGQEGMSLGHFARDILVASTQNTPITASVTSTNRTQGHAIKPVQLTHYVSQTPTRAKETSITETVRIHSEPGHASRAKFADNCLPTPLHVMEEHTASEITEQPRFSRNMGSPASSLEVDDWYENFDDDDKDMMDAAQAFEQSFTSERTTNVRPHERQALSEISPNQRRSPSKQQSKPNDLLVQQQHPWSKDVILGLKKRFHLHEFRHNQLEAINATLDAKDTFVLMPTGGGKSLCYQLPAIIQTGKTHGVTIVISPLLSLMQDQVDHLQNLKIQAFMINSEVTAAHRKLVFQSLRGPHPETFIQLLYVTPEMLGKSQAMLDLLENLHKRNKLARIVIDEAHCVSQWGHDFRPDYKNLGPVRQNFPGVPVMALTATATENVKIDTIHNLGMAGCRVFTQSFNRPNLTYEVRPKPKGPQTLQSIAETINEHHEGESGIIYCLSRKNCEQVAEKLQQEHSIRCAHYHAGMSAEARASVQKDWQKGKYHVIVATIAFGMGIDKPDVRFVIHHTIPKSLEGYYQETGRAGRDGKPSQCYLYYGYGDTTSLKRMIDDGEGSNEQKERQKHMLRNVVQFCENKSDCRRVQVLAYFNEHFNTDDCQETCDNCRSDAVFETKDFTDHAKTMIKLVRRLAEDKVTLLHCVDIYRGAKGKKLNEVGHDQLPEYGKGSNLEKGDVERLFYRLLSEDAIVEYNQVNRMGFASQYVRPGKRGDEFLSGHRSLTFQVRISSLRKPRAQAPKKKTSTRKGKSKVDDDSEGEDYAAIGHDPSRYCPTSTIISSPVEARSRKKLSRRKPSFTVVDSEDDADSDFDGFEPVHRAGVKQPSRKHNPGPPITLDEQIAQLDEYHRHILNDFIEQARRQLNKIAMNKSLRQVPITDTVLREIGIKFPLTEADLRKTKGMDDDKVKRYGHTLLPLIKQSHADYQAMIGVDDDGENDAPAADSVVVISEDEQNEISDVPYENDDEDSDQMETSHHFNLSRDVAAFNRKMSQTQTLLTGSKSGPTRKPKGASQSKLPNSLRKGAAAKRNGLATKSRSATITKKQRTGSVKSGGTSKIAGVSMKKKGGAAKPSQRSSSGISGIGLMPT